MADPNFIAPITNAFGLTDVGYSATPTFADIDGDGDLDAFVGNFDGNTLFYRNTGTASAPTFTLEATNFGLTNVGRNATPTFADIDGDGDLDAFVGNYDGNTLFYRNTGTAAAPNFTLEATNPFGLTNVGYFASPTFADIDGDGDLDAFLSLNGFDSTLLFYRNTGTTTAPTFDSPVDNPFGVTDVGYAPTTTFVDIDNDGDLDAFIGKGDNSDILFYRNIGTTTAPNFTLEATNPFGLTNVEGAAAPSFVDIDGDGDLDAFVGEGYGDILFFENTSATTPVNNAPIKAVPNFITPIVNPFGLTAAGGVAALVDIDGDGDLDAFVGNGAGDTVFYRNTGTASAPTFTLEATNPFGLTNVGGVAVPTFADIDGDGDLDAFVGNVYGNTVFYRNTGTAVAPTFTLEATNPFGLTNEGWFAAPTFADIDGDGDLDAFVSNQAGNTVFYRNTGTAVAPTFTLEATNPFGLTDVGFYAIPTFADIDGDGDLDAFLGQNYGNTVFYRNTGTVTAPSFTQEANNPFGLTVVGYIAAPTFADIDGDGDLDAFVGNNYGNVFFFENQRTATTAEDTAIIINAADLLADFSDVDGDSLSVTGLTTDNGSLVDNLDGTYTFTPVANFNGTVTLTYGVSDGTDILSGQTLRVYVTPVNDVPVGFPTASLGNTAEDTAIIINAADLLAGFSDVEGDTLSVAGLSVDKGSLVNNFDGTYTFTPIANFNGAVTLTYGVSDGTDTLTGQTQTFSVTPVNDAPTGGINFLSAQTNSFGLTNVGTFASPTFADIDNDGDLDAFVGNRAGDTLFYRNTGTASAPTFTPETTNPFGLTNVGTFSAPTFADIDGDGDLDAFVGNYLGDTLFYRNTGTASAPTFTPETTNPFGLTDVGYFASPTFADIDNDGDLDAFVGEYYGNTLFYRNTGTAAAPTFTLEATNPFGLTDVGYFASPTFADIDNDGDLDAFVGNYLGDTLFYRNTGTASAPTFTPEARNPFGLTNAGTFASPTFADIDGDGDLDTFVGNRRGDTLFSENISGVKATLSNTAEDTAITITAADLLAGFSDVDAGDTLSVAGLTADNGTLVDNLDGTYTFTPTADFNGTVTLTYGVTDGTDTLTGQTQTFSVTPVNDAATITGTATASVTEDATTPNLTATGSLTVSDVDAGQSLFNTTVTSASGNLGGLTITQNGAYSYSVANSVLQYLGAGQTKAETFTVKSVDGTATQDIVVTINGVNDAPTGSPTAILSNTPEDTAITITAANLLAGFTDVDAGDILAVANLTATNGALVNNNNGTYTFTPTANFNGAVNLTYNVTDGTATLTGKTSSFSVTPVNDAPTVAQAIADQTTLEDGFFSFTLPANTFADVDAGDSLTYTATLANGNPLPTWLTFNANTRTFSGTPNDPDNGKISIKVTATDTSNATAYDTFDLTVTPVNDAPVASDDSASTNQNTPLTLLAADLLANDTDVDSSTLRITAVSNAVNGSVTLNGSGNVVFTPTTSFTGNASFNYTLSDGNGGTDLGIVTVAVGTNREGTPQNDTLIGTSGNDIINGLPGNDIISGNAGNDTLIGDNGDDFLYGGTGDDQLYGGNGDDNLYGEAGNDRLEGDNGEDNLYGGDGNDILLGGNGKDTLVGGAGNDFLNGGEADDLLTGGTGSDIFVLAKAAGRDTITDFSLGQSDKIGLSGLSFNQLSFSGNEIRLGNQTLAVLTGFDTTTLTQKDFTSV